MKQERVKDLFDPVMDIQNDEIMVLSINPSTMVEPGAGGGGDGGTNIPWE